MSRWDITARKTMSDELQVVATDLRALIENANAPIIGTDEHGRVNEWNRKAAGVECSLLLKSV